MSVLDHYRKEKERFLESCTQCGLCAKGCPIIPYTDAVKYSYRDIQKGVFDFLDRGTPNQQAFTKAFACMECFKCTSGMCPEGLNPMLINQLIKSDYIAGGLADSGLSDAGAPGSGHRVMATIQTTRSEYNRITTAGSKRKARYVFFPGCNVYLQPEKLLNALDIMDIIGDDYAFLAGLNYCCGENNLFYGDIEGGSIKAAELVSTIAAFDPEYVVLWCPTCHCVFEKTILSSMDVPFKILSFPQYLTLNMNKLPLSNAASGTATLHEACKSAYTKVDCNGPREVLRSLPGVNLIEMEHHGENAMCCGSGAASWFPKSCARIRETRLKEAKRTGAARLVTICHYCGQTFISEEKNYNISVVNYVNLVAEAIGVYREDKFKKYTAWGDIERIMKDAGDRIEDSPFSKNGIIEVLRCFFEKSDPDKGTPL